MTPLFVAGALSMMAQVVVLRELVAALFGVELLYVLALGSWLAGTAAGASLGRRAPVRQAAAVAGCAALGVLVPADVALIRMMGTVSGGVPGAYLPFPVQLAWILAATLPPAAVCGLLFPLLTGLADSRRHSLGKCYGIESAGAAAGGAAVTLMFWLGASTLQVAVAAAALALGASAAWSGRRRGRVVAVVILLAATVAGVEYAGAWDFALLRHVYPALVDAGDTPYSRVVITRSGDQLAVFENGALAFDTEGTSAEAFADLAAVQHAEPRRVLVIGGGSEGVPDAVRRHGIAAVDNVEIDARAYELVRSHTAPARPAAPGDPQARVVFDEPRRFLERADPYDLMLVAAGEPTSGASSRFYTREFFRQCARRLAPGGVLAVRLAAAENVWPRPLARRTASIYAALRLEFTAVEVVPGATLYLFASNSPLSSDPVLLASRLRDRGLHPRLITPPYLEYLYGNDRREEVRRLLASTPTRGPNRDAAPVCYQYAAMLWLSKFYPDLAAGAEADQGVPPWARAALLAACTGAAIAWLRRRPRRRLNGFLFAAGFIGMVLESVLLLRYQVANGIVFQQVGWLLTCFMAGLTAGGYACGRTPCEAGVDLRVRHRGLVLTAGMCGVAALVWASSARVTWMTGLTGTSVLLFLAGFAVGACFAFAATQWGGDRLGAAASLYAADVAGGAAGALIATLYLVPAAGLDGSALLAAIGAAAMGLVIPRPGSGGR